MRTGLLALLCCLLLAVVAAEAMQRPGTLGHAGAAIVATRRPEPREVKRVSQAGVSRNQWVAASLARPLFAPDRRPVAGVLSADPGMPRLAGIIASPDGAVAIFQPAGTVKPVVARSGERIGGWEVTAIAADAVNLRKENNVVVLSPRFDGAVHTAVARQEQARPRWEQPAPSGMLRARWANPQLQP
jgi:general secretion pathway protein N